uniref:Uncharacterized protein n=1 Tax=Panagrolaimus superbus TaxID=310955 RepID=A0A914YBE3_9BILA
MPVMSSISQSFSAMHFSGCFSRAHRPYSAIAPSDSAFAASTSTFNAQRRSRNSGNFESRPSTSTSTSSNQTFSRQQQHHETPHPSSSSSLPPSRQNSIRARGHTRRQQKKR